MVMIKKLVLYGKMIENEKRQTKKKFKMTSVVTSGGEPLFTNIKLYLINNMENVVGFLIINSNVSSTRNLRSLK